MSKIYYDDDSFENSKDESIKKRKRKDPLFSEDIKIILDENLAPENYESLMYSLNEAIDKELRLVNKYSIHETEDELASSIIEYENSLNKYNEELRSIQVKSPIPIDKLKSISLAIFLEEEKLRGAQEKIIIMNTDLIKEILNKYQNDKLALQDMRDVIQEAYLSLMVAVREFDFSSIESFRDYAASKIINSIDECIVYDSDRSKINEYIKSNVDMFTDTDLKYDYIETEEQKEANEYSKNMKAKDKIATQESSNKVKKLTIDAHKYDQVVEQIQPSKGDANSTMPLYSIPNLSEVIIPKITNEDVSLIVSKSKMVKKNKFNIEEQDISTKQIIDSIIKSFNENTASSNIHIPKLYSKLKFDNDRRLSLYAKRVGERSEEIIIKYLYETLSDDEKFTIKWTSKRGETPGWDIEYLDVQKKIVAIEVKGTTGKSFPNVEITANEWNAANALKERFFIYLVSDCLGKEPKIQKLQNPVKLYEDGILYVTPIIWKIELLST